MRVLGIETSCDETGVAVYDTDRGLLAHALHSQVAMHQDYGGVVPELASRDHVRRVVPLIERGAGARRASAWPIWTASPTRRVPGLAGALLVGASVATALAYALRIPAIGVHHLEGHLLSPLLGQPRPAFPFVALLVSGGHSQLFDVAGVGQYRLLGDTLDDAAGEAFDKTSKLLGLPYPGGPALAQLAERGTPGAVQAAAADARVGRSRLQLLRAQDRGADARAQGRRGSASPDALPTGAQGRHRARVPDARSSTCWSRKRLPRWRRPDADGWWSRAASAQTASCARVCSRAPRRVAARCSSRISQFCTDNGAMIALVGALRLADAPCGRLRVRGAAAVGAHVGQRGAAPSRKSSTRRVNSFGNSAGNECAAPSMASKRRVRDRLRERGAGGDREQQVVGPGEHERARADRGKLFRAVERRDRADLAIAAPPALC